LAITTAMCTSFKGELLQGLHDFTASTGHDFYIALYDDQATLGAATTDYSVSDEVVGAGYNAGGEPLTSNGVSTSGTTAFVDFVDVTWSTATITAAGALIYNTTTGGGTGTTEAVCVLDFGGNKTSTAGDFVIQFPTADATDAIIRIA
jgi:hypothetical protein